MSDPLPGVIDLPLTAWRVMTRRLPGRTEKFERRRSIR
jgi:predicted ATP-grasp superfamily ATP-dependent carboligase